jgi:hypothetical protein
VKKPQTNPLKEIMKINLIELWLFCLVKRRMGEIWFVKHSDLLDCDKMRFIPLYLYMKDLGQKFTGS